MRPIIPESKNCEFLYIHKEPCLCDVRSRKSSSSPSGKDRTTIRAARPSRMDALMAQKHMPLDEVIACGQEQAEE